MSYTPTNWTTGDTITATKLNKMEQGIADGGSGYDVIIKLTPATIPTSATVVNGDFDEIMDRARGGLPISVFVYGTTYNDDEDFEVSNYIFKRVTFDFYGEDRMLVECSYSSESPEKSIVWTSNGISVE